jgi:hypothetical protein
VHLNPDFSGELQRNFTYIGRFGEIENKVTAQQGTLDVLSNASKCHFIAGEDNLEWRRGV